jgi:hypothetical protein
MQDPHVPGKSSTGEYGRAPTPPQPAMGAVRVPRCDCCGALVPQNQSGDVVASLASCMVCDYRNS